MADSITELDEILSLCIKAIEEDGWTVDDCLSRFAARRDELGPQLRAAMMLRQGRNVMPSSRFRREAKARLLRRLAASKRRSARQVVTNPISFRSIGRSWILTGQRRFGMAAIIAVAIIVVGAVFGGAAYAADASGPGDPLYGVDLAVESVRLQMTSSDDALAKLQLRLASERLDEAKVKLEEGASLEDVEAAMAAFDDMVAQLEELLATGDLTPEERANIEAAITALQGAREAAGLGQEVEVEVEGGQVQVETEGNENGNGNANANVNANINANANANANINANVNANLNGDDDANLNGDDDANLNGDDGFNENGDDGSNDNGGDDSNDNGGDDGGGDDGGGDDGGGDDGGGDNSGSGGGGDDD